MMLGVNLFALAITSIGLILSEEIGIVMEFLSENPEVIRYLTTTAIASSFGQLTIFFMLREFGPVVLTVVMTIRQMMSICLSAFMFNHSISIWSATGVMLVFGTVACQIRRNYNLARQPEVLQAA